MKRLLTLTDLKEKKLVEDLLVYMCGGEGGGERRKRGREGKRKKGGRREREREREREKERERTKSAKTCWGFWLKIVTFVVYLL